MVMLGFGIKKEDVTVYHRDGTREDYTKEEWYNTPSLEDKK